MSKWAVYPCQSNITLCSKHTRTCQPLYQSDCSGRSIARGRCRCFVPPCSTGNNTAEKPSSQRWGIEEVCKLIKCRLEVADFSGLTARAIQQDFYARTLLISLCNTFCFGIKIQPTKARRVDKGQQKEQQVPIINRTYALHQLKAMLTRTAFDLRSLNAMERKIKPNSKFAMSYKYVQILILMH